MSQMNPHTGEGVQDKTAAKARSGAENKHPQQSTAKSIGKFGALNCHTGEGKSDKNAAARGK